MANPVLKTRRVLDSLAPAEGRADDGFSRPRRCVRRRRGAVDDRNGCVSQRGRRVCAAGRSFPAAGAFPTDGGYFFWRGATRRPLFGKWHLGDSYPNLPNNRAAFGNRSITWGWGHHVDGAILWLNGLFRRPFFAINGVAWPKYPGYLHGRVVQTCLSTGSRQRKAASGAVLLCICPNGMPRTGRTGVADKYKQMYAGVWGAAGIFWHDCQSRRETSVGWWKTLDETGLADQYDSGFLSRTTAATAGVNLFTCRDARAGKDDHVLRRRPPRRRWPSIRWPGRQVDPRQPVGMG